MSETYVQPSTYVYLHGVEIPETLPMHFPSAPNLVGNESESTHKEKPLPRSLSGPLLYAMSEHTASFGLSESEYLLEVSFSDNASFSDVESCSPINTDDYINNPHRQ